MWKRKKQAKERYPDKTDTHFRRKNEQKKHKLKRNGSVELLKYWVAYGILA